MPKSKRQPLSQNERKHSSTAGPSTEKRNGARLSPLSRSADYAYVMQDEQPAFVLVPVDEYERLTILDMAQSAIKKLTERDDRTVKWVKAEDAAMEFAAAQIVEARKAAGLTQRQMAERLNLPLSELSRIERSADHTDVRTIKKLARALRVDVRSFVRYCENVERDRG